MTQLRSLVPTQAPLYSRGAADPAGRGPEANTLSVPRHTPRGWSLARGARRLLCQLPLACATLALFAGGSIGCSGEDEPSAIEYQISYVNDTGSLPNIKQRNVVLDEGRASPEEGPLVVGGGSWKATPRGQSGYDVELFDADGTRVKLISCDASEVANGSKEFEAPLALGGSYNFWVKLTRATCSATP